MQLVELARTYQDFYAPAFSIRIGNSDLMRDWKVAISQIEVDLMLGAASRFSFTIANAFQHEDRKFKSELGRELLSELGFGTSIDILMGYGDAKSTPLMMKGMITEIGTNFPDGDSPELSISGYDHGFPLTIGKSARTWSKKKDSFAVKEIASFHNLQAKIEETKIEHALIQQDQETDWEFLKKLADNNKFEIYIDERSTLHFAPARKNDSAIVTLNYGGGLLSFKPEANLAGQVSRVEVSGWDIQNRKEYLGVASAGQEDGKDGKPSSQTLKTFIRDPKKLPTLRLRQPVRSLAEANDLAAKTLHEKADKFLTGDGECIGVPDLRPDRNVKLDMLGPLFSKTYYLQQTTHKIDSSGYRTRFKVKENAL
jgi:phage protein D